MHGPSTCRIADPIVHEYTHAPGPTRRVRCRSEHVPPGRPPYSYWGRARTLVVDVLALHIMSASAASPASPSDPSLLPNISHRVLSIVRRPLNTQCQHSLPIASAVSRDVRERILCVFRWQHGAAAPQHHSITRICCAAQLSVVGIMHMSVRVPLAFGAMVNGRSCRGCFSCAMRLRRVRSRGVAIGCCGSLGCRGCVRARAWRAARPP